MKINSHQDLKVWQESMDLVEHIYRVTTTFPNGEQYGLTSQMRRAAISIPSNISEGAGRKGGKEFQRFLHIAMGSLSELETQIEISNRLKYIEDITSLNNQVIDIRRMLSKLIKSIVT